MEVIERLVEMNDDDQAVPPRAETRRLTEESKRLDRTLSEAGFDVNSNLSIEEKMQLYKAVSRSKAEAEKQKSGAGWNRVEPMEEESSDGGLDATGGSTAVSNSTSVASSSTSASGSNRSKRHPTPGSGKKPSDTTNRNPSSNGTDTRSDDCRQNDVVLGTPSKPRLVHRPAPTLRAPPSQSAVQLEDCRVGQVRTSIERGAGPRQNAMEVDQDVSTGAHVPGKQPSSGLAPPGPSSSAVSDSKTKKEPLASNAHLLNRPFDIFLVEEAGHVSIRCEGVVAANGEVENFGYQGKDAIVVDPVVVSSQGMRTWLKARKYHELDTAFDVRREAVPKAIRSMSHWDPQRLPGPCPFPPTYTERYGEKCPPGDMSVEEGAAVLFQCQVEFRELLGKCRIPLVIKNDPLTLLRGGPRVEGLRKKNQLKKSRKEDDGGQAGVHDAGEVEEVGGSKGSSDEKQVLPTQPSSASDYLLRNKKEQRSPEQMDFESGRKDHVLRESRAKPNQVDDDENNKEEEEEEEDEQQELDNDADSDWEEQTSRKRKGRRGGKRKGHRSPSKANGKGSPKNPGRPRKDAGKKMNNDGRQQEHSPTDKPSTENQHSPKSKRLFHEYEIAAGTKKDLRSVAGRSADLVTCPLCGGRYPGTVVESHAATCGEAKNPRRYEGGTRRVPLSHKDH